MNKFLPALVLLVLFSTYTQAATPPENPAIRHEVKLIFGKTQIRVDLSKTADTDSTTEYMDVVVDSDTLNHLRIATPQYSAAIVSVVPATLLTDFAGLKTLQADIKTAGFDSKPEQHKLKHGTLYQWETPTSGSAMYYYLQNPSMKTMAVKIGPLAGSVGKDLIFDWAGARWSNKSR